MRKRRRNSTFFILFLLNYIALHSVLHISFDLAKFPSEIQYYQIFSVSPPHQPRFNCTVHAFLGSVLLPSGSAGRGGRSWDVGREVGERGNVSRDVVNTRDRHSEERGRGDRSPDLCCPPPLTKKRKPREVTLVLRIRRCVITKVPRNYCFVK